MITITLKTENAAFNSDGDRGAEVARILRRLADEYADGRDRQTTGLYDVNGNKVGTVKDTGPFDGYTEEGN